MPVSERQVRWMAAFVLIALAAICYARLFQQVVT
jgi:hypothetical protein